MVSGRPETIIMRPVYMLMYAPAQKGTFLPVNRNFLPEPTHTRQICSTRTTSARASRIAVTTFGSAPRSTSLMVLTGTPLFTASSG